MRSLAKRLEFDGWLSVVFVIGALAAFIHTYTFPDNAAIWPRWVIGSFGILCALVVFTKLISAKKNT